MAETVESAYTYGDDLWDKFTDVTNKITTGKDSVKQLMSFFKSKADIEEKVAKFYKKTSFNPSNLGQLEGPMESIITYTNQMQEQHSQCAGQLSKSLYKELSELKTSLSKTVKSAISEEKKLRKEFNSAKSSLASAKSKEQQEKKEYESLQKKLSQSNDLPPKKQQNLQNQVHNAEKASGNAEKNYQEAHQKCGEVREKYYAQMADLLNSLEELDRRRIKTVTKVLENFLYLEESQYKTLQEQVESMRSSIDDVDEEKDIQQFIADHKSGMQPPPLEKFDPYNVKVPDDLNTSRFSVSMGSSGGGSGTQSPVNSGYDAFQSTSSATNTTPPPSAASNPAPEPTPEPAGDAGGSNEAMATVVAMFDYEPEDPENELPLRAGDEVAVLEMEDGNGWWMGENNGSRGYFPSNFVEQKGEDGAVTEGVPAGGETVNAIYGYSANEEGELTFAEGDTITVLAKNPDGWWEGECNGQRGIFPSNFSDAPDAPAI
eukprot:gb/GECH01002842.1/.p1 GENE.gb/GECH01002842.1/~~gb/GECH01002842.1/.p1  ORF type:complete len:488 (+),score=165.52 gb/GECH01002842.1/:1-1464(+)